MKKKMILRAFMLAAILVVLGGCGKDIPPPDEEIALAGAAISQAETAESYRHAPLELKAAREKLSQAERLVEKEEYEEARRLAEGAEADANLAFAKSRTAAAQEAVTELRDTIRTLQQEMERIQAQ